MEGFNRHGRIWEHLLVFFLVGFTHLLPITHAGLPLRSEPDTGQNNETVVEGCVLGGISYKLSEKWSLEMEEADMKYCVKCICIPVNKVQKDKMYWTGKVSCQNIRKCPRPTCQKANDSCCNTCPNLSYENKPFWKHKITEFTALLVGSNFNESSSTHSVAIADISVRDSNLYYSMRLTRLKPAAKIMFVLENNNIIHEITIGNQQLQKTCRRRCSAMMQLCGVWRKLPLLYHEYLREKRVSLVITTKEHPEGLVKGLIFPASDKKKETLTALLVGKSMRGAGGRAYFTLDPTETNIDYSVTIVTNKETASAQENVFISIGDERRPAYIKRKSDRELIILGTWTAPEKRASRHLVRGRFSIVISTQTFGTISGKILPRMVCGKFQAVLSGDHFPYYKKYRRGIGSASFQLQQNGNIKYKIGLSQLGSPLRQVIVERNLISGSSGSGSSMGRRRKRNNGDLTKQYRVEGFGYGGWANGTYTKPKVTDLNRLINGELYVKVSTNKRRRMALLGQIVEVPYHEHCQSFAGTPLLLVPPNPNPLKYEVKAYAWLITGVGCQLHYQIMINGRTTTLSEPLSAYLTNSDKHINSPQTCANTSIMGNFYDNVMSGTLTAISPHLFKSLNNGTATLRIINRKYPAGILEVKVFIPNNCWKISADVNGIDSFLVSATDKHLQHHSKCNFENRWYEEAETWLPTGEKCRTCSCRHGHVMCVDVLCPPPECKNPVRITGLCCPVCPELEAKVRYSMANNISCYFDADRRWHVAGTTWYPFLHPFGYSVCAICFCLDEKRGWNCQTRNCSPLACASSVQKINMTHCCPVCHDQAAQSVLTTDTALTMVKPELPKEGVCIFKKVTYPNEAKWYTSIMLLGEPTCGACMCKNGLPKCTWTECSRFKCSSLERNKDSCCYRCQRRINRSKKNRRKIL